MVAKKPQDHQRKKPTVKEVDGGKSVTFPDILARTADGKTIEKDGNTLPLTVTVDTVALDDFELLDDMRGMDDGNHARMPAMLRRLVGDDYKAVLEAFRIVRLVGYRSRRLPRGCRSFWGRSTQTPSPGRRLLAARECVESVDQGGVPDCGDPTPGGVGAR